MASRKTFAVRAIDWQRADDPLVKAQEVQTAMNDLAEQGFTRPALAMVPFGAQRNTVVLVMEGR